MSHNHIVLLNNPESREMVERLCAEHGFEFTVFEELIEAEMKQIGKLKKHGLWLDFDEILDRIEIE